MADQGIWFKLWDGWENDSDLANLTKEDMLHWVLLGGYLKKHGSNGMACISKPAIALQKKLMLPTYESVVTVLKKFPNCVIEIKQIATVTETVTIPEILTIIMKNWFKYQGDSSKMRTRKWRSQLGGDVTPKKRREEKRREVSPLPPLPLATSTPKVNGLKSARTILKEIPETERMTPEEMQAIRKANLKPKPGPEPAELGAPDDVF